MRAVRPWRRARPRSLAVLLVGGASLAFPAAVAAHGADSRRAADAREPRSWAGTSTRSWPPGSWSRASPGCCWLRAWAGCIRTTRCRSLGRPRSSAASRPSRSPCSPGSSATTRRCSRSTWSSTCSCCSWRRRSIALAAPVTQLLRAASPACAAADRRPPPLRPDRGARAPGRGLGHVHGRHVGEPLLAAVRRRARERGSCIRASTSRSSAPACCSGGRWSRQTRPARRLSYPVRALYLLLQMPPSSFLGMLITFASAPLYPHYATLGSPYGIDPLADQQAAGGIMWLAGDVVFIAAILFVVAAWMRHEERDTSAAERRVDAKRAALRARADQLERTRDRRRRRRRLSLGAATPAARGSARGRRCRR